MENTQEASVELLTASSDVMEKLERANIDIQIATAKKYPRSIDLFRKRAIEMATIDEETAKSCLYKRDVGGGKMAEGMSIRMAEIVASSYGNLRVAARIIDQTPEWVKAQGVCHDLEANIIIASEVIESTLKTDGKPYSPRQRVVVAKAALSKAIRDSIFRVIPRALCRPIEMRCQQVINDPNVKTTEERRNDMVRIITEVWKLDPARVWAVLGIKGKDDLGAEQFATLAAIQTAVREGDATYHEEFPPIVGASKEPSKPDMGDGVKTNTRRTKSTATAAPANPGDETDKRSTEPAPAKEPTTPAAEETAPARETAPTPTPNAKTEGQHKRVAREELTKAGITDNELSVWAMENGALEAHQNLDDIPDGIWHDIYKDMPSIVKAIKKARE